MESALAFIGENLARDLSDINISRHVGITPTHLCRLFKAELGEAPMQHVQRLRMKLACELLLSDEYPHLGIKEIAAKVGCNDVSHFVRDFEKWFGLSPKRYREGKGRKK
jgi:two-component system response regulator YesN